MNKNNEKIVVCQIVGKWVGGGIESFLMNYYRNIDRNHITFDFICDSDSTNIPYSEIEALGGRVILIPPYQKIFSYIKALRKLFRENKYYIVHSHINTMSFFCLLAAKLEGVPIRISHSHTTTSKREFKKNIMKVILRPLVRLVATHYMSCTEHAGRWMFGDKNFDSGNVYLLNNAIEIDKYKFNSNLRSSVRESLGIDDNTLVIGHVGRFVKQKNHKFLLKVFKKIHDENKNSVLLLIGQGPLMDDIKSYALKLGISDSVIFLGQREDVCKLYNAMDLFLFPSLYEGLGIVVIEAQANGIPCIVSTDVPMAAKISNNIKFISLDESLDTWKNVCLKSFKVKRGDNIENILKSGYSIIREANKLELKYFSFLL